MTINLSIPQATELKPKIFVIGVGGAGGNAVNNMIESQLEGVEFLVTNTDAQALSSSHCDRRIQLGVNITQGLGAGSRPDVGRAAAEEALDSIISEIGGCHMAFITAGMGGGTGTGGAPVIARAARDGGILTVGVVTKPFQFEGSHRMTIAEAGIEELQEVVDTLIIIPNQNLFRIANEKTTFADAFKMADDVLHSGVRGVTDLMVMPGLINLDFADVKTVMSEMGKAMMGTGQAEGDKRALEAAEAAISNPLLDDVSMKGARGVLINITGGMDLTLFEVDEAANRIRSEVDPDANIIVGSTFDDSLAGQMRVSVVATGIGAAEAVQPRPLTLVAGTADDGSAAAVPARSATALRASLGVVGERASAAAGEARARQAAEAEEQTLAYVETRMAAGAEDQAFIAPRPIEPAAKRPALRAPEPFAEAAVANGGAADPKKKPRVSLFERVTGSRPRPGPASERPEADTPKPTAAVADESLRGAEAEAETEPTDPTPPQTLAPRSTEDDLLEIPAFLRRQAN